jgi:hypothetical protein
MQEANKIDGTGMILGMRVITFQNNRLSGHNCSFQNEKFQDDKYQIVVLYGSVLVELECSTTHGQCGSGWTTASWGNISYKILEEIGSLHYTPIEYSQISFDLNDIPSHLEHNLFKYSEYGYDDYYPGGGFTIEMDAWRSTGRKPEKPMVHVFCGHSGTGKSTVASLTEKTVIESDSFETSDAFIDSLEITKPMGDAIIVVGGKHQIDLDTVTALLEEHNTVVKVNFSF